MESDTEPFPEHTIVIPGPHFHVDLPALDARHPVHYSRRLLFFRCAGGAQRAAQLAALQRGLHALLQVCPVLGGRVAPNPDTDSTKADWRTLVPAAGLALHVRDRRSALPSFAALEAANFPPAALPHAALVPVLGDLAAACEVQLSALEGGTVLALAMSHTVTDGGGLDTWMAVLADAVAGGETAHLPRMGEDRRVLREIASDTPFELAEHPGYRWKAPPEPAPPHPFVTTREEVPVLLRLPAPALPRLKAAATAHSTHDALAALVWRTTLLIRSRRARDVDVDPATQTRLFLPCDARTHLGLEGAYVGNAVYQLAAALPLGALLGPGGLAAGARALRAAITFATPERVRSCVATVNSGRALEWAFLDGSVGSTGVALGTNLGSGPALYARDWGAHFGKVVRLRQPAGGVPAYVLPRRADGSVEVVVCVLPEEAEVLRGSEGFGPYLE
jgi:hypothetical protein